MSKFNAAAAEAVAFDKQATEQDAKGVASFKHLEALMGGLKGNCKSKAETHLNLAFTWLRKALAEDQIERNRAAPSVEKK